ncbi:MAG: MFS transporter [Nanoarchaeota archaeon]|nr:MFS transporter [Nanoarchaeota archaeon]
MGILIKRRDGMSVLTGVAKLSIISLITAISASLVSTIWALYIDSFVHSEVIVGLISAALTLVAFFSYFLFVPLIEKNSKSKIFSYSLLSFAIAYILFAITSKFYIFLILAFLTTIIYTFKVTSFGIIVRDKSKRSTLSRNEGIIYTAMNIAWVIGPLIAGFIANKYGISHVFLLSSIFIFIALLFFSVSGIKDSNINKKVDGNLLKNFYDFFKDKQRTLSYLISGGVNLWWSFIYLFMPLHIIRSGLNDLWVGYFLFGIAVPLILGEYKFSKLTLTLGHKKIFKIGYFLVAIISFICFFIQDIYILLGLLIFASVGMAMVEPTTEAYFFKILKKKSDENRFYGPYNTTIDFSSFIGRISGAILLIFLPFNYLFLLYGFFMLIMVLLSYKIKNIF